MKIKIIIWRTSLKLLLKTTICSSSVTYSVILLLEYNIRERLCPNEFKAIKILWPILVLSPSFPRTRGAKFNVLYFLLSVFVSCHLFFHLPFHFHSLILFINAIYVTNVSVLPSSVFPMVISAFCIIGYSLKLSFLAFHESFSQQIPIAY